MFLSQTYWSMPVAKFAASRWCGIVATQLAQSRAALAAIDRQPAGARSCDDIRTRRALISRIILQRLQPRLCELEALQSDVQLSRWLPQFNQLVGPVGEQLCDYMGALQSSIDATQPQDSATFDCGTSDPNPLSTAPVASEVFNDAHAPSAPSAPSASAPAPADAEEAAVRPANDLADREELMTQMSSAEALMIIAGVAPAGSSTADGATAANQPADGKGVSKSKQLLRRAISQQDSGDWLAAPWTSASSSGTRF